MYESLSTSLILSLSIAGLVVSLLSALEKHVQAIMRLCTFFGEGCRRTADFTLLGLPVALWGAAFYLLLPATLFFYEPAVFWLVALGVGFELTFVWIMTRIRAFCIFCLLNALVVGALAIPTFDPERWWQGLMLVALAFAGSSILLHFENREEVEGEGAATASGVPPERIERCPAFGSREAPVTVLEFSDYCCPACRKAHETVKQLRSDFADQVRWVFMDFPLDTHAGSRELAAAARCAADQNRFWEFQDIAFCFDRLPGEEELRRLAREMDMDADAFLDCVTRDEHQDLIEESLQAGKAVGVSATPTFFVNGRKLQGAPSPEEFASIIEEEAAKCRQAE